MTARRVPTVRAPLGGARLLMVVWLAGVLPAILATLHSLAIVPLVFDTIPLAAIQRFDGAAYTAPCPTAYYLAGGELPYRLHEDGRPTPFPSSPGYGVVMRFGSGRFSLNGETLFFSTTDNSDPRSNGRRYTVVRPTPLRKRLLAGLWALAFLVTASLVVIKRRTVRIWARPSFGVAALVLVGLVAANRLWFFVEFPIVAIHPDSGSYYAVAEQLGTGVWPNFGNRPPVYPLFLKAVFSVTDRVIAVAAGQTALSLLAGLLLVYGAYCWAPWLALPAAGVVALFLFGFTTMEHDTAMLSESLYTSLLMLCFAGLLIGLAARKRALVLSGASTAMALAALTRPGGVFLVVSYLLVVAWICWNRFTRRLILSFVVPFPLLMTMMSAYNWRVVGAFVPTTWGEANLAVATFVYWQTDPSYPVEINQDIEKIQKIIRARFMVTQIDPSPMSTSWDPDVLGPIFVQSFNAAALDIAQVMGGHYETVGRAWIRRIAFDSIRKRPGVYARFVWAMMYNYYKPAPDFDFRVYLQNRAWLFYIDKRFSRERGNAFMTRLGRELADGTPPRDVIVTSFDPAAQMDLNERIVIRPTRLWRVYEVTHRIRQNLFEFWGWSYAVFVALIGSTFVLVRTRGRDGAAFVLFIITISALGASLVVSLVEYSQPRYSYPMEWVYGLSVVLLPLLFFTRNAGSTD